MRISRLFPAPVRRFLRSSSRKVSFFAARHALRIAGPRRPLLKLLIYGWGNSGYSADIEYLMKTCELAEQAKSYVLECGSGLTTVLLDIFAPCRVLSLEHIPSWAEKIERHVWSKIVKAPLKDYGTFDWYNAEIPNNIDLVICDGPPASTRGGRYGLLPVCRDKLTKNCIIFMDDFDREDERVIADKWVNEYGARIVEKSDYAILKI